LKRRPTYYETVKNRQQTAASLVCIHVLNRKFLFFFFKSGSSGKSGRPWQNAGVCMEKIVAYRAFGVAETFLGYQVNASTAACFTCSLNYIFLLLFSPTETASNCRSKWKSIHPRGILHWGSNATRCISFYGIYVCHRIAKAVMTLADWINRNWIRINKLIFSLTRESNVENAYMVLHCVVFLNDRSIRNQFFLKRSINQSNSSSKINRQISSFSINN